MSNSALYSIIRGIKEFLLKGEFKNANQELIARYGDFSYEARELLTLVFPLLDLLSEKIPHIIKTDEEILDIFEKLDHTFYHNTLFQNPLMLEFGKYLIVGLAFLLKQNIFCNKNIYDLPIELLLFELEYLFFFQKEKEAWTIINRSLTQNINLSQILSFGARIYSERDIQKSILFYKEAFLYSPSSLSLLFSYSHILDAPYYSLDQHLNFHNPKNTLPIFMENLSVAFFLKYFYNPPRILDIEEEKLIHSRLQVYQHRLETNPQSIENRMILIRLTLIILENLVITQKPTQSMIQILEDISPSIFSYLDFLN